MTILFCNRIKYVQRKYNFIIFQYAKKNENKNVYES